MILPEGFNIRVKITINGTGSSDLLLDVIKGKDLIATGIQVLRITNLSVLGDEHLENDFNK